METLTIGDLYHIVMMVAGAWVMVFSVIFLVAFMRKKNQRNYYSKKRR